MTQSKSKSLHTRALPITCIASTILIIACLLLLAFASAYAWLVDKQTVSEPISIALPKEEAFAGLYELSNGTYSLVFDRADNPLLQRNGAWLRYAWRGMETGSRDFDQRGKPPWISYISHIVSVESSEATKQFSIGVLDMENWFSNMPELLSADVSGITPNTAAKGSREACTSLNGIFYNCRKLSTLNGLSTWQTKGCTDIIGMFSRCSSLREIDLSNWNVEDIYNADQLLYQCTSLQSVNLSNWTLSNCSSLRGLFYECEQLVTLIGFDTIQTPKLHSIESMFYGCKKIRRIDFSGFDMEKTGGTIRVCSAAFDRCDSLEYLDLSGLAIRSGYPYPTYNMFPNPSKIKTFVISNRISLDKQAPVPALIENADYFVTNIPYWIRNDTQDTFSQEALGDACIKMYRHPSQEAFKRIELSAFDFRITESDSAYTALYYEAGQGYTMVMNKGVSIPFKRGNAALNQIIRGYLVDGSKASEVWRAYSPVKEVIIETQLTPLSCKEWFAYSSAKSIQGLNNLDMSKCLDVTNMFMFANIQQLNVSQWKLQESTIGIKDLFRYCNKLEKLDLTAWDIQIHSLYLTQADKLSSVTLPPNISVTNLGGYQDTTTKFFDGYWYINGIGEPRNSYEAEELTKNRSANTAPITLSHERIDRSYAGLYENNGNYILVFGRGLSIPDSYLDYQLTRSFRGLEEQHLDKGKFDFANGAECPWVPYAKNIVGVYCDNATIINSIKPRTLSRWFQKMDQLEHISALESGSISAQYATDTSYLFFYCTKLKNIPESFIRGFTNKLRNISSMFAGCRMTSAITPLPGEAIKNVTSAERVFEECNAITSLDLSSWDLTSLSYSVGMFAGCERLEILELPENFVSQKRSSMLQATFDRCYSLRELDASTWDTSSCYTMFRTFNSCRSLTKIKGAESWNTSRVADMSETFRDCRNLELDCTQWNVSSVTEHDYFNTFSPNVLSPFETTVQALSDSNELDAIRANALLQDIEVSAYEELDTSTNSEDVLQGHDETESTKADACVPSAEQECSAHPLLFITSQEKSALDYGLERQALQVDQLIQQAA